LARAGHDVTLIAVHDRDEVRDGVQILGLPEVARWRRPGVWRALLRRARETGADLYHFHDPELLFIAPLLARRTGTPTVYDVHEAYPEFFAVKDYLPALIRYPMAWAFRVVEPRLAGLHDALVFADDFTPEAFRGVRRPKAVLPNFPAADLVGAGARELSTVATRQPIVLYLGGLERNRGSRLMIEAFARVHSRKPDARLLHVGHFMPPELRREFLAHASKLGLAEAVCCVGRIPHADVGDYLDRAAVGWVTWQPYAKNQKNVPTKLFEYMAYGLPVVSSDLNTTRPFVEDGVTGHLVEAANPTAHAEAILGLLNYRERAARMGRCGRELVLESYHWQAVEHRLLELYQRCFPIDGGSP
jgi:glycosyltransferase involved in cell wall biosynthesis